MSENREYAILMTLWTYRARIADKICMESRMEESLEFIDRTVKNDEWENSIAHEFVDKRREAGVAADLFRQIYDEDGRLLHVIYCIESIDEEKTREPSALSGADRSDDRL